MSIKQMSQVWEIKVDHAEQAVLMSLADHAKDDGSKVFPSTALTSWKTGYSDRQVRRVLKEMRNKGWISIVRPARPDFPAEYKLHLDRIPKKTDFRGTDYDKEDQPRRKIRPDTVSTQGADGLSGLLDLGRPNAASVSAADVSQTIKEPSVDLKPSCQTANDVMEGAFKYYLQQTGRNENQYSYTKLRKQKGLGRFHEALEMSKNDISKAKKLIRIAIDNLVASDFHMAGNYYEWEKHLFPSREKFEFWLNRNIKPLAAGKPDGVSAIDRHRKQMAGDFS